MSAVRVGNSGMAFSSVGRRFESLPGAWALRRSAGRFSCPTVGVAQLVELLVVVQAVVGSSPIAHPFEVPANLDVLDAPGARASAVMIVGQCGTTHVWNRVDGSRGDASRRRERPDLLGLLSGASRFPFASDRLCRPMESDGVRRDAGMRRRGPSLPSMVRRGFKRVDD
jgi:hypothetical protein